MNETTSVKVREKKTRGGGKKDKNDGSGKVLLGGNNLEKNFKTSKEFSFLNYYPDIFLPSHSIITRRIRKDGRMRRVDS